MLYIYSAYEYGGFSLSFLSAIRPRQVRPLKQRLKGYIKSLNRISLSIPLNAHPININYPLAKVYTVGFFCFLHDNLFGGRNRHGG